MINGGGRDNLMLSGLSGSMVQKFTSYKVLYPIIRDGGNLHAILSKSTYYSFRDNIAVKHFKDNMQSFCRTADAIKDLSRDCFGKITATCVKMPITAEAILSYAKAYNADTVYIEDISAYNSDEIREILNTASLQGIRIIMNTVYRKEALCEKYNLGMKGVVRWYKDIYGDLLNELKVYIGTLESSKGNYCLFDLQDYSIRTFSMMKLFE